MSRFARLANLVFRGGVTGWVFLVLLAVPTHAAPAPSGDLTHHVFTIHRDVPIGGGQRIRVNEHFTLASLLRFPRRGVLLLNGTAFHGTNFSIPVEGYDATEMIARKRMIAITVDYLGVGGSSRPADGIDAGFAENVAAMRAVVKNLRKTWLIPKLDLVGEGIGGAIATQLAADSASIRSVSMVGMLYKTVPPGPTTDPAFVEMLLADEDGYIFVPPEMYLLFFSLAPPEAQEFILETQPGVYPIGPFLVVAEEPPYFDPGVARAPGLVLFGPFDFLATANDPWDLVRDYGQRGAELVVIQGGGHVPRIEGPGVAAAYWDAVFDFIER
jgi:pimeloyl-ACP methyl ester carboxylesterase